MGPTKPRRSLWPFPEDTPTERARRVARSYRNALAEHAPRACAALDRQAEATGQHWVLPAQSTGARDDDMLTAQEVAAECHVATKTVYEWKRRGLRAVDTREGLRFRLGDALDYQADLRRRRAS